MSKITTSSIRRHRNHYKGPPTNRQTSFKLKGNQTKYLKQSYVCFNTRILELCFMAASFVVPSREAVLVDFSFTLVCVDLDIFYLISTRHLWRIFTIFTHRFCTQYVFFVIFFSSDSGSESGSHKSIRDKRPSGPSDGKPTRVRTVLNEKQLHTLR